MKRTELKRSTGLSRYTRLKPGKPLQRTQMKRTASKMSTAPREPGPSLEVVEAVLERDNYSCVLCGMGIGPDGRGVTYSIHHRKRRSQGGEHTVQNLIVLDGTGTTGCHGVVHANPDASYAGGWLLKARWEPMAVPVLVAGQRRVYLTCTGEYREVRHGA